MRSETTCRACSRSRKVPPLPGQCSRRQWHLPVTFPLSPVTRLPTLRADEVRKERKKETKHDNLIRVAGLLHEVGPPRARGLVW
jgi:hypothetical protein